METFKEYMKTNGEEYYKKIVQNGERVTGMENAQNHITHIFNHVNSIKRSFVYLMDAKESTTEDFELNIYRSLGRLELQLRGLQREIRELEGESK
jgi:hypothetical protein